MITDNVFLLDKAPNSSSSRKRRERQKVLFSLKPKWPLAHNKPHTTEAYLGVIHTDLAVSKAFATSELDL